MLKTNEFCQNWLDAHSQNIMRVYVNEGIQCGYVCRDTIASLESHSENAFIMSWILQGRGEFWAQETRYAISPECVCIRRPRHSYRLSFETRAANQRYFIRLPTCLYDFLVRMHPQLDLMPPIAPAPYDPVIHQRFIRLLETVAETPADNLYYLLPDFFSLILDVTTLSMPRSSKSLMRAKSLLEQPGSAMSLEEIAARCEMSYGFFRKSFRREYGVSPGQYRIEYRVRAAKRLLRDGNSVSRVAELLNYPDVYTFSHQFRELAKCSPTEYVQRKRLEQPAGEDRQG